jgi:hypothetical protein
MKSIQSYERERQRWIETSSPKQVNLNKEILYGLHKNFERSFRQKTESRYAYKQI